MASEHSAHRIVLDFLVEFMADKAAGSAQPLAHYLNRYPGHEEAIASQYLALQHPTSRQSDSVAPTERTQGSDESSGRLRARALPDGTSLGRFTIRGELGRGGQGVVYLAEDTHLKRDVALKVLDVDSARADDLLVRFRREAEVTSRLDHPGICTVYEAGREAGLAFIAMRFLNGETLSDRIRRNPAPASRPEIHTVLELVEKAARALHAAHEKGVVHRDVKPANIMVMDDETPVILDFGLARDETATSPSLTGDRGMFGTPPYMSPEQFAGRGKNLDRRTDVYALGVTLFQGLTTALPFDAPTVHALGKLVLEAPLPRPSSLNRAISRDLDVVLETALERDLERRYQNALAFADDLRCLRESRPIDARPASTMLRLRRWTRRNPALATAASLLIVALVVGTGLSVYFMNRQALLRSVAETRLEQLLQASDHRRLERLLAREAEELWPVDPSLVEKCASWFDAFEDVAQRRAVHTKTLAELERGEGDFATRSAEEKAWLGQLLRDILRQYGLLDDRVVRLRERLQAASELELRTLEEPREEWQRCRAAVRASSAYAGLELAPQLGLRPLRVDEDTGLWEFWHVLSGDRPVRDRRRERWRITQETGLVFVLIPGGTFGMGADEKDDPTGSSNERGKHPVQLDPFFLSKYEMTQAQWARLNEGANPAVYNPQNPPGGLRTERDVATLTNPVEQVSWEACARTVARYGLLLPTEAQWEYACRAGTEGRWTCGGDFEVLFRHANLAGRECESLEDKAAAETDDRVWTAPVGRYQGNDFGLHDIHGNVWEWCRDRFVRDYATCPPNPGDGERTPAQPDGGQVLRGGGHFTAPRNARITQRNHATPQEPRPDVGLRPARRISPALRR